MTDVSDFGFGMDGGSSLGNNTISVDLGLDTTDGAVGDRFVEGTHKFAVSGPVEVNFTTGGETQIILPLRIIGSHVEGALNQAGQDRLLIPGADRRVNEPDKWKTMMKFFRLRLEGITGREWRQDNAQLDIEKDFYGCVFIATVTHDETVAKDDSGRKFVNANLKDYVNVIPTQSTDGPTIGFDNPKAPEEPF